MPKHRNDSYKPSKCQMCNGSRYERVVVGREKDGTPREKEIRCTYCDGKGIQ